MVTKLHLFQVFNIKRGKGGNIVGMCLLACFNSEKYNDSSCSKLCYKLEPSFNRLGTNFVTLKLERMVREEKAAVESHLLKASGLEERDKRYKAIQHLFAKDQLDFMFFEINFALDIRRGLLVLGLECRVSRNKVVLDEDGIKNYYENVMGLKSKPKEEDLSYYQRMNYKL